MQGMKYEVENESELECLNSIHTCYHDSFFLLRTPVTISGKPVEIQLYKGSPILTCQHSGQELSVSLSAISRKVAPLLLKHGVYHVDTFYCEQVPLFSVVFSSKASLKRFLSLASGQVKCELESVIGEEFTKHLSLPPTDTVSSSQLCQVDTKLYLVTPDRQKKIAAEVHLVTLANYSHYSSKWQGSRIFDFTHLFQSWPEETQGGLCSQRGTSNTILTNQYTTLYIVLYSIFCQVQKFKGSVALYSALPSIIHKVSFADVCVCVVHIMYSLSALIEEYAELEDLVNELTPITQWFHLGMKLDISKETLLKVKHDGRSTAECRRHMLMEWGRRERPTWSKVVGALTAIGRKQLAEKVAVKYGNYCTLTVPTV